MSTVTDIKDLAKILLKHKVINDQQHREIRARFDAVQKKVKKNPQLLESHSLLPNRDPGDITTIDVVTAIPLPDSKNGKLYLNEETILKTIAKEYKIPFRHLDPLELELDVVTKTIPKPFAQKHLVVPLYKDREKLVVAINDPENQEPLEGIRKVTGLDVAPCLATQKDILKIIVEFFGFKSSMVQAEQEFHKSSIDLGNLEQLNRMKSPEEITSSDEHVTSAVEYIFNYAMDQRASDIHLEPKRDKALVRFRIDGILHEIHSVPKGVYPAVASRIKMLARMNISEKRRPQDGRIKAERRSGLFELRVSSMPVAFGEKIVIRILQPEILFQDLESLGLSTEDLIRYQNSLTRPHGIILLTGPTGSGKTTTLYSSLKSIATSEKNVVTIEDPIETICEDFNQIGIQTAVGITFSSSLRHVLRQDPDIIMIGEIRDSETAENAIHASLTGHLVLSTLHTNDSVSAVSRLMDLEIESFLISTTLTCVVAQRLVRTICPNCRSKMEHHKREFESLQIGIEKDTVTLWQGMGCELCRHTGYLGRIGVYEVLSISDPIQQMIKDKVHPIDIFKHARKEGLRTLKENAIAMMLKGTTTFQEVIRMIAV